MLQYDQKHKQVLPLLFFIVKFTTDACFIIINTSKWINVAIVSVT